MSRPEIPASEQLRPIDRLTNLSLTILEYVGRGAMIMCYATPPERTEREQIKTAIEQLESHANDPLQHD